MIINRGEHPTNNPVYMYYNHDIFLRFGYQVGLK